MDKLSDYVMVDNVFSPEECELYIKKIEECTWKPHRWYRNASDTFHDVKDFDVTYSVEIQNMMREKIYKFVCKYYEKHRDQDDPECQYSGIRFNKYNEGESIKPHVDHIHALFDGKKKGIPVLSFVGVLNDDFEGGDFMLCGEKVNLKQGDCVVFPSVFLYPHWVNTVTKGTRYSWVLWSW